MKQRMLTLLICSFGLATATFADADMQDNGNEGSTTAAVASATTPENNAQQTDPATAKINPATVTVNPKGPKLRGCPPVEKLSYNPTSMIWSVKDNTHWTSYDKSFARSLSQFIGAQWQGVQIGQIMCLYKPSDKYSFPVTFILDITTNEPTGGAWGKNFGGGKNCKSTRRIDCAFTFRAPDKPNPVAGLTT